MKIQIKNRYTNEIIVDGDYQNLREAVEKNKADLSYANLSNANLSYADLSNANLSNADLYKVNLSNANLYKVKIKITQKDELLKALKIEVVE